jgi:tetratricopeptide (TPR) repeat protein
MAGANPNTILNGGTLSAFLVAVILCVFLVSMGRAGDFELGNELFDQGKYLEAKERYEKLVEAGEGSANVFYNLGNVDYRIGSPGRAMLNYERALALDPRHPEALANLKLLREQSGAKLPALPWIVKVFASQPLTIWTLAAAVTGWTTIFAFAFLLTSVRREKGGLWFLALLGVIGLGFSSMGVWQGLKDQALGIITAKQTDARLAPAESAGVAETLPAGSRVRVLSERGAWIYCELPGAGRGWIPEGMLERVRTERS